MVTGSISITLVKGDVVYFDLGTPPNEIKGHEQGFKRPCIVVKPLNRLGLAIVIPLTSKTPKNPLFTIVKISKGEGGLTSNSFALCHQIRTLSLDRLVSIKGRLDSTNILKIDSTLIDLFGFDL